MSKPVFQTFKRLRLIPEGKVSTYGRIAKAAGLNTPRHAGKILHNNPDPIKNPCHRIVFSDGSLAPAFAFGGENEQRFKLMKEGVKFKDNGKVDLEECLYEFELN